LPFDNNLAVNGKYNGECYIKVIHLVSL
jgi:hypothetical protein